MSRLSVKLLGACALAATAAATVAAPAEAQTVTRIVAFGDSYADDGNLFQLLGIPCPSAYPNCRFSNGTNFVDTMGRLLIVPIDNFAIGGAFTGNGNINGPGIPGFVTEYQSFLAGGGPAAFPRVSGTFGPTDLVVVSIGGNDARAYERSLGLAPTAAQIQGLLAGVPAQASARVTEATAGLNALVNAGARNITFLAGDVGRLPEVQGLPVAQVGTAYATAFNNGMKTQLADIASRGVIVNYLDLNLIGDRVQANLAAFGLTSAGACPNTNCVVDSSFANQYLFYVDQVHLTSRGFEIVGEYAVRQLEAPLHFAAQTEAGLQAATAFGATLQGRMDLSQARSGGGETGLRFYVAGNAASRDFAGSTQNLGYELDTFGISGGIEYASGPALVGVAINYSRPEANMASGTGETKVKALQGAVYGAFGAGGAFVQAHAGWGSLDYEFGRDAVIDRLSGESDGSAMTAGAKAGYLVGMGGLSIGPVVGLSYAKAKLDGYTETGDPVLTNIVQDQEVKALVGSVGVELRGNLGADGAAIRPYAALTAEKDFEGDSRTIRYAGTASPMIVNSFVLPDRSKETYGRIAAGASVSLGGAFSLEAQASRTFEQEGGNETAGFVGLKLGF